MNFNKRAIYAHVLLTALTLTLTLTLTFIAHYDESH